MWLLNHKHPLVSWSVWSGSTTSVWIPVLQGYSGTEPNFVILLLQDEFDAYLGLGSKSLGFMASLILILTLISIPCFNTNWCGSVPSSRFFRFRACLIRYWSGFRSGSLCFKISKRHIPILVKKYLAIATSAAPQISLCRRMLCLNQCCGAGSGSRKIRNYCKVPPGARAVNTIYSSGAGSFYQRLEEI